jgi:hypothetical protein
VGDRDLSGEGEATAVVTTLTGKEKNRTQLATKSQRDTNYMKEAERTLGHRLQNWEWWRT